MAAPQKAVARQALQMGVEWRAQAFDCSNMLAARHRRRPPRVDCTRKLRVNARVSGLALV